MEPSRPTVFCVRNHRGARGSFATLAGQSAWLAKKAFDANRSVLVLVGTAVELSTRGHGDMLPEPQAYRTIRFGEDRLEVLHDGHSPAGV